MSMPSWNGWLTTSSSTPPSVGWKANSVVTPGSAAGGGSSTTFFRTGTLKYSAFVRSPVDQTLWHVVRWRDGKASRISRHSTEAEALEAAGLSEYAMSEENVEAMRRANAAFNRGDVDGAMDLYAPEAEFRDLLNAPDQKHVVKGVPAIREAVALWTAEFDDLRAEIEDYTATPNAVICAAHWWGQGKASGISIDIHQFDLYEFREGKVVRATLGFRSKNEALEAAELSE
jgi:ketosteroid isomerase-like protein